MTDAVLPRGVNMSGVRIAMQDLRKAAEAAGECWDAMRKPPVLKVNRAESDDQ